MQVFDCHLPSLSLQIVQVSRGELAWILVADLDRAVNMLGRQPSLWFQTHVDARHDGIDISEQQYP